MTCNCDPRITISFYGYGHSSKTMRNILSKDFCIPRANKKRIPENKKKYDLFLDQNVHF